MQYQYRTLSRGGASLMEQLRQEFGQRAVARHVCVCQLRVYGRKPLAPLSNSTQHDADKKKSEDRPFFSDQIFVHSKLMLVDDESVIIGSNNLNDRSLIGDRDSELGAIISGASVVKKLRLKLWLEHLGISSQDFASSPELVATLDNPASEQAFSLWRQRAELNTKIFEKVFPSIPSNNIRTWAEFQQILADDSKVVGGAHRNSQDMQLEHAEAELKVEGGAWASLPSPSWFLSR
eukprot:CAMPEP_0175133568 /NCGR_PEP_ID=MMETSP0087-20121206/7718_1 /TAXON_ID=136419 /ORGANISM="Unknown Unknown, Strain D1" /LENGTH=234 /DNA_ID=CAMNT_0016416079 /DNA_START=64 /DNA_END=768 /DNA_ORIENTATION=+